MKIIEALKNLQIIQKRIDKNCQQIREYCSYLNVEVPAFETPERQKQEVDSLIQANLDLEKEYLRLKLAIEHTNLITKVTIGGFVYTISELVSIRRIVGKFRTNTYASLDPSVSVRRLQLHLSSKANVDPSNPPKVINLSKEEYKNIHLREWENFIAQIDGTLEVVNATVELSNY